MTRDGNLTRSLLIEGATLVNVFSDETYPVDVLCRGEHIASVAPAGTLASGLSPSPAQRLDGRGSFLLPGLINGHLHVESSMITPQEYARAVLPHGTTTLVPDPHEIANVLGMDGLEAMMASGAGAGADFFWTAPSCVPASPLDTAGARIGADEISRLLADPRVVALGELMNYPGVLAGDPEVWAKLSAAKAAGKPVDGHAPGLTGADLDAYVAAGASSEHEAVTLDEAREKLRRGMWVMARQGSVCHNLAALLPLAKEMRGERMMLVTDDVHPHDLLGRGELDNLLRMAVAEGLPPVAAVRMATLNPATYFRLWDRGIVAPGRLADLWLVRDLVDFESVAVIRRGRTAWQAGDGALAPATQLGDQWPDAMRATVHLPRDLAASLRWPHRRGTARVIGIDPGQVVTRALAWEVEVQEDGAAHAHEGEVVKVAVVERHGRSGAVGLGLAHGLGIRRGAVGSSVAHDSHNLVLAGTSDADLLLAASELARSGGGHIVVAGGRVLAHLPLPLAGLMSLDEAPAVAAGLEKIDQAAGEIGATPASAIMALSFVSLPVIPELKLTDQGLVDVTAFRHVGLWR